MKSPAAGKTPAIPLFDGLADHIVAEVLATAVLNRFAAGSVLCRQGERAASLLLVRNGRMKFVRTAADGRDVVMRWLGPGDSFGIASLLAGPVKYMGSAVAVGEGRVYRWDAAAIQKAAEAHPRLAQNALGIALRYFKEYADRHLALLATSAEHRLARTLTHLGATDGRILPSGVQIDITNRDLGSLADVGMYTVSRQLRHWARHGHLVKKRSSILVRRPEALLEGT